jgi:Anti-sigma-28 factor, FlgM
MRLHLDTSSLGPSRAGNAGQTAPAGGLGDSRKIGSSTSGAEDSIRISGASDALSRVFADRTARITQLTAAVQSGRYEAPSGAISRSIVDESLS